MEQVLKEAEMGYLLAISFDVHNMLNFMRDVGDSDYLNHKSLLKLLEDFEEQWRRLAVDGKMRAQ